MKKKSLLWTVLGVIFLLASCSNDETDEPNSADLDSLRQEVTEDLISGSWIITSFIESGVDETDDFTGYEFTFNQDGSLTATNGTTTVEGSWSITSDSDDSSDDSPDDPFDDIDFNIFFASPDNFNELTEDWEIVSHSANRIDLLHISGGDGSTDTLTFVKN